ncbi:hypothetical protein [Neisseria meningitidis]|uniref:hypothetical protein n=1 Tax=Neisseria meningitidis TaxID=487 RepID=UPI00053BC300|nr:hypothetical protein [Neisseria meningitidis]
MASPRPYGLLNRGLEPTARDRGFIDNLVMRALTLKEVGDLLSVQLIRALPDGGVVLVRDAGGILRAVTDKPPVPSEKVPPLGFAHLEVPSFYSGIVTKSVLLPREKRLVGIRVTQTCRRRIAGYDKEAILPAGDLRLARMAVEYGRSGLLFKPDVGIPDPRFHSQYAQQLPSWYSGAMAEVVQVVGGYGRQDFEKLPKTREEQVRIVLPEEVAAEIGAEIGGDILPGCSGLPPQDGQYRFDCKFDSTHLVSLGGDGTPWLVHIAPKGVYVMPLPLVPATTAAAFRRYMESVGDDEVLYVLDRFGGLPSGEGFPERPDDFAAWEKAGVIIRVCGTEDFYGKNGFSSVIGWTANRDGTEMANTCYDYDDETAYGIGYLFRLNLKIGSVGHLGRAKRADLGVIGDERLRDLTAVYVGRVLGLFPDDDVKSMPVRYKLRLAPVSLLVERARRTEDFEFKDAEEREFWTEYRARGIARVSGRVAETLRGTLVSFEKPLAQPQVKFPEPLLGACISHDFSPNRKDAGRVKNMKTADTPVFVYFVGDDMRTLKYYREWGEFYAETRSNFEPDMTVGNWYREDYSGKAGVYGYFYSSDIDRRKVLSQGVVRTDITGRDAGYDSKPRFAFDSYYYRTGTIWRNRYYTHHTVVRKSLQNRMNVAVCVPYFMRNALLYAVAESAGEKSVEESLRLLSVADPHSYRYWTDDRIFAWIGSLPVMKGLPYPKDGAPVWVEMEVYEPSTANSFADEGSWIFGLPQDYTWLVHPNRNEWLHSGGGGAPNVREFSKRKSSRDELSVELHASVAHLPRKLKGAVNGRYFVPSPHPKTGHTFYRDGCKNMAGLTEYANVEHFEGEGERAHWGETRLFDSHGGVYSFIGVVNE